MDTDFQVFSSLRYDPALRQVSNSSSSYASWNHMNASALYMLDFHRDRMLRAVTHWGWEAAIAAISGDVGLKAVESFILQNIKEDDKDPPLRVKIELSKHGKMTVNAFRVAETALSNLYPQELPNPGAFSEMRADGPYLPSKSPEYEVIVADLRTTPSEYTHFKTTKREMYDMARQRAHISLPDLKEVLIINEEDGSVMEGSVTTPYFWRDERWVTPSVNRHYSPRSDSGGQDGTSRRWALERSDFPLR